MLITVHRSAQKRPGTFWSPADHTLEQRQAIELVRRETPEGYRNKVINRIVRQHIDEYNLLVAGTRDYTDARIEDSYKRGKFAEGFVFVRALAAFVHKSQVEKMERISEQISPGAIIGPDVKIGRGAHIGGYAELEKGVRVRPGAVIGGGTVLRKGSFVGTEAQIAGQTYLGQFAQVGANAKIGSLCVVERGVNIRREAKIGQQCLVGVDAFIDLDSFVDDTVRIGRRTYLGAHSIIGEMTGIGDYCTIGNNSTIGAESRLGRLVRVSPNVMLMSPTYAEEGAVISQSNAFVFRPHP